MNTCLREIYLTLIRPPLVKRKKILIGKIENNFLVFIIPCDCTKALRWFPIAVSDRSLHQTLIEAP